MNKFKLLILYIIFTQFSIAQEAPFFKTYSWDKNPSYKIENADTNKGIVALKHAIINEFYFEDENSLTEYYLEHEVLWLNSDEAIEQYNKVYIPYTQSSELNIHKARVITNKGEVIELDESKILHAEDEETGRKYKYFAFEGVEKGSFIEYYYVIKKHPKYKGKRLTLQSKFPKKNVSFDFFAPKNLEFKFKSYNNLPEVEKDTLTKDKLHWKLLVKEMKPLEEEETSAYEASKKSIVYKLHKNLVNNKTEFASYSTVSKNLYSYYYQDYPKKVNALVKSFVTKAIKGSDSKDKESVIRKLEFYVKSNVYLSKANTDELEDLESVLNKKVANETGMLKLYVAALKELKIKHEMVLTCDRQDVKFDKEFEAHNFLIEFLIYFPNHKTYLSPIKVESRYGFPPAYFTDNYGLFIKEVVLGDFKSGVGSVKYIKAIEAENTVDKMIVDVDFDKNDLTTINANLDRSMGGYYAMYFQPFIDLVKAEDIDELVESFAKNLNEGVEITNKSIYNDDPELFGVKPFQVKIEFNSDAFVEKAGSKYLFKLGELIGPQMQLYQEKERVLPVESEFNRSYVRTLNVKIPKGYKIANLDDINIDNSYLKDGKELLSFKSFYEIKDDTLIITADEYYRVNIIDTPFYEEYRKVINSAADFNKITLVLEQAK